MARDSCSSLLIAVRHSQQLASSDSVCVYPGLSKNDGKPLAFHPRQAFVVNAPPTSGPTWQKQHRPLPVPVPNSYFDDGLMVGLYLIAIVIAVAGSEPCPSACAAKLRQSLVSILASDNFLVLVHQILRMEPNPSIALQKSRWTCFKINSFEKCIHKCPSSPAKSALVTSLDPYDIFCKMVMKPSRGVLQYFRCERDLLLRAEEICGHLSVPADKNIKDLCRNMEKYRQCYAELPNQCTNDALKLKRMIDESLMETTENLVKLTTGIIPTECTAWRQQSLKRHEWRTTDNDDDEEDYEEESTAYSLYNRSQPESELFAASRVLHRPTKGAPSIKAGDDIVDELNARTDDDFVSKNLTYSIPDRLTTSSVSIFVHYVHVYVIVCFLFW